MTKVQIRIAVMLLHILFRITFFLKQFGQCLMFNNTKKVEGDGGGEIMQKKEYLNLRPLVSHCCPKSRTIY